MLSFSGSLRARLMLLVLVAMVPGLALTIYTDSYQRRQALAEVENYTLTLAKTVGNLHDNVIEEGRVMVTTLAHLPQVEKRDAVACNSIFANMMEISKRFVGFNAVGLDGVPFAWAPPSIEPVTLADRPYFQALLKTQEVVVSEYIMGRRIHKPVLIFGAPVFEPPGKLSSVILASLSLDWLKQFLAQIHLPAGVRVALLDRSGKVLACHPDPTCPTDPGGLVGLSRPETAMIKAILTLKEGVVEAPGLDGIECVIGFTTLDPQSGGIHIAITIPREIIYAKTRRQLIISLATLFTLMTLALGVAWFGGDVLVRRPANVLLEVTRRLREGDLSARSGLTYGRGEIDQLARAFDEAAESLQRREAHRLEADETLRQSEERFRLLVERVKDYAIFMLDPAGRVVSWNAGAELIKGYRAEEIIGQHFSRFYSEEDRQQGKPEQELEQVREQGSCENRSWRVRQDGSRYFADVVVTALRDEQGDLLGFADITRDITELKKAEDSLNLLVSGIEKVAQVQSLQDLAQEICLSVAKAFDFRFVWLGQIYPDGVVRPIFMAGDGADCLEQLKIRYDDSPQGRGPVGRAIRDGVPVVVNDIAAETDFAPWSAIAQEKGYRSAAAFPLIRGREPFGNLSVYSDQTGFFNPDRVRLLSTFAGIAAKFLENARLTEQTERRFKQLASLKKIDLAMASSTDLRVILDVLVEQVIDLSGLDAAAVLLFNPHANRLEYTATRGLKADQVVHSHLSLGDNCLSSRVLREHRGIHVPDLNLAETDLIHLGELVSQGFVSYLGEPLVAKGKDLGVLEGYSRTPLSLGSELLAFFAALAGQAAIAIDHTTLFDDLRRSHHDLTLAYDATLEGLARTMELRDYETQGHSERVTEMTVRLAQRLGMSGQELDHLRRGALLHDIGKIGIPDSILLKPGPLDEAQWKVMWQHPEKAFRLLAPIAYLKPSLDIPYCHHEKWDGSGYPRGLAGEVIPLAARIFAIVDVWDALSSDRPYKSAWPVEKILETLKEQAGKHFDPRVVEAFLEILMEEATSA